MRFFAKTVLRSAVIAPLLLSSLAGQSSAQTAPAVLPGGANSLQETYQDWSVGCGITQNGKVCSMSQTQQRQDGQRVLTIEIQSGKDGSATGALVLPFGLQLDAGASLKADNNTPLQDLRFTTCLPIGCLLPVTFTAANITTLKTATALNINATSIEAKQPVKLSVSLKGFSEAFARLNALLKS